MKSTASTERNAACPCRSGKKFKKCCALTQHEAERLERLKPRQERGNFSRRDPKVFATLLGLIGTVL